MVISTFKSVGKAYVLEHMDLPWQDIAQLLMRHHPADRKEDVLMFNMAEFKQAGPDAEQGRRYKGTVIDGVFVRDATGAYDEIPNTVRRCKNNVISLTGIVLDVDENMTLEEAMATFQSIEYVLYTTFRHTFNRHKFRIVIPFSQPLLAQDIAGRQASIIERYPLVDHASFTLSQSFYFHSGSNDPIVYHNKGYMLDPYNDFEYRAPKVYVEPVRDNTTTLTSQQAAQYKESIIKSLLTCSGLHYAGQGANNLGVLTLVSICKSIGCSYDEFDNICQRIASADSQLMNPHTRRNAWISWTSDRIRADKRDEFIKAHNGIEPKRENKKVDVLADMRRPTFKQFKYRNIK
jgi:hypothetical protein